MKKILGILMAVMVSTSVSAAEILAVCTAKKFDGTVLSTVYAVTGYESKDIYQDGNRIYSLNYYNNDLSRACISIGRFAGGGVWYDFHFRGDLNNQGIEVTDPGGDVRVVCQKYIK